MTLPCSHEAGTGLASNMLIFCLFMIVLSLQVDLLERLAKVGPLKAIDHLDDAFFLPGVHKALVLAENNRNQLSL